MKIKHIFIFLSLNIFSNLVSSQVSGYMGKRLSIQYDKYISPALLNEASSELKISKNTAISINNFNSFSLDYVLNRKMTLGFRCKDYKTKLFTSRIIETTEVYNPGSYEENNVDINGEIKGNSYGLNFRYYKNNIAPIGKYIGFGFEYMSYKLSNSSDDYIFIDNNGYFTYGLSIETGYQRVFFNRIITHVGISMECVFDSFYSEYTTFTESNAGYYLSNRRLLLMSVINFDFGIGILLF